MKNKIPSCLRAVIFALVLLLSTGVGVGAAAAPKTGALSRAEQNAPIVITSDRMEAHDLEKTVVFSGHVMAQKGPLRIYANRMEVYQAKNGDKISKLVATGHVRIVQEGKNATGDQAVYYEPEQKVVLTGNPKAWEGENSVTGTEITYYLDQHRSIVKGTPGNRVEAVIVPTKEEGKRMKSPGPAHNSREKK